MTRHNVFKLAVALLTGMALMLPVASTTLAAPPANDNFSNATPITALPFSDSSANTREATTEAGEPQPSCASTTVGKTIWYAFTPAENGLLSAYISTGVPIVIAAYTGDSLPGLTEVACHAGWGWERLTFHANAGTTYYFQVGDPGEGGGLIFNLVVPPANDNFANATVISLPFTGVVNNTEATTEPDEPQNCSGSARTVWYSITPGTNAWIRADMVASNFYDTNLVVYQAVGPGLSGLSFVSCASYGGSVTFNAQAETTYYLQAGSVWSGGGDLQVNVHEIPPPPNDNFNSAKVIPGLPFSDTVDTTAATREADERTPSCAQWGTLWGKTVWYAFTPEESGSISAYLNTGWFPLLAAYTGGSLAELTEVGCRGALWGRLTFRAQAGKTYFFQAGGVYGDGGSLQFNLEATPPPVASFSFWPGDPSVFDTIQFYDYSWDPGEVGFQLQAWEFGDGTTGEGCCPTHRYATDGDYTVQLTVTTYDGRTAPTSQVVHVKTHDVAIIKFLAPQAAKAGQTRQIVVGINSKRYPENVEVQLHKSVPGGFQWVGTLTQYVPVRSGNRTTDFNFSYTFTNDDATVGKVTFKAVANIVGARDALPADNEAIASPTKVSR